MKPKSDVKAVETYYAPFSRFEFLAYKLDAKGKRIPKISQANGNPLYDSKGNQTYHILPSEKCKFLTKDDHPEKSHCVYTVNTATDPSIAAALKELAASPKSQVVTERVWMKRKNPEMVKELERRESLETEVKAAKKKAKEADDKLAGITELVKNVKDTDSIAQLKKKLSEIGG